MTNFVAVSDVRHGNDDGTVTHFVRGEVVDLGREELISLYSVGALAVEGSSEDPNTWPVPENDGVHHTTPAMIQDSLEAQARALLGPEGADSEDYKNAHTQPGQEQHSDPASLIAAPGGEPEGSTADNVGTSAGGSTPPVEQSAVESKAGSSGTSSTGPSGTTSTVVSGGSGGSSS